MSPHLSHRHARWKSGRPACQMRGGSVSQGITVSPATEMGAMGDSSSCFQH